MNIHLTNFKLRKGKEDVIVVNDVIVTGQDKDALMADSFYLKRALKLMGVKNIKGEAAKYKVIDIEFIRTIGETNT